MLRVVVARRNLALLLELHSLAIFALVLLDRNGTPLWNEQA